MAVVEDMQECERGVFIDGLTRGGVDKVPGGANISIGDIERVVERFSDSTGVA